MPNCFVCKSPHALEEHHTIAQASGGTSGRTIWLCANCHALAHKAARALKSKNADVKTKGLDYIPADLRDRMYPIVQALLAGNLIYEMKKDRLQDHAIQGLQIPISPRQMTRLHTLKQTSGFTNLDDFLSALIVKLTGVRAWPKGTPECDHPPTAQDLGMLRAKIKK